MPTSPSSLFGASVRGVRLTLSTAQSTMRLGVRVGAGVAGTVAGRAEGLARQGFGAAAELTQEAVWTGRNLVDLHERRQRRRVWSRGGHAHIEVRGLDRDDRRSRRVADGVTGALRRVRGVRWAEINAVTGQVLVAFDDRRVDVGALLDTVREVEDAHGTRTDDFPWEKPTHPGDHTPVAAAAAELAADCVAFTAAVAERLLPLPPLSPRLRLAITIFEFERRLRGRLKRQVGPIETDLVLSLANAAVHGLTEGLATPAVDGLYRALLLAEVWERRKAWERREPELTANPACVPPTPPEQRERPTPRPRGPIEVWTDRIGPAAPATAAAVLAFTRNPGRAADAMLAATPKAARYGRGAFAAVTGRNLARDSILPMNAAVLRRFDRISAIVIDSAALSADSPAADTRQPTATRPALQADAVLDAAHATGAIVIVEGDAAAHVRRLQEEGHGVLAISRTDDAALAAADAGVAVPAPDGTVCWSADLICRDDLTDVWRILRTVAAARGVSSGAVRLAQAGSTLGGLLAFGGWPFRRTTLVLVPVHLAALAATAHGAAAALRATGEPPP